MNFKLLRHYDGVDLYGADSGGYQFCISYDKRQDAYAASWKSKKHRDKLAIFIGEKIHPVEQVPYFDKWIEAEQACKDTLKQLKQRQ